ncbi:hypothetical protein SPI_08354 [Niveomyces insectorum RCEF 264]|uniref:Uncharacterized protein n=1 Tax=Niveomyces insectorum RCEF 264 TaxID=1081102 RepID=A0A167N8K2_9HYPO|nr:hypothetical protein SPI_08354 [Niveomyces insectorum RCEF 264]
MDDPGWSWPAWKFGMRRDALLTTLHERYNTFQSTIQDPDAFHHDVFEIANEATTTDDFHRLLADRREQRLRELNDSLESASYEIIANPALIGTAQWELALQLFRTRSLDSLVRYFASYLPADHRWNHRDTQYTSSSTKTTQRTLLDDAPLTHEPLSITDHHHHQLPPSPRSVTTCSDDSDASSRHVFSSMDAFSPVRTLSFSDSENDFEHSHGIDHDVVKDDCPSPCQDDDSSQSSGPATPASLSEMGDEPEMIEVEAHDEGPVAAAAAAALPKELAALHPETKTKRPSPAPLSTSPSSTASAPTSHATLITPTLSPASCGHASGFCEPTKPTPLSFSMRARHRSVSPSGSRILAHTAASAALPAAVAAVVSTVGVTTRSGRSTGRPSRLMHFYRAARRSSPECRNCRAGSSRWQQRQHSHERGHGVEKQRPIRTRLRERREAGTRERC